MKPKTRAHGQGSIWAETRARGRMVYVGQVSIGGKLYQRTLGDARTPGAKDGLTRSMAEARLREVRAEIEQRQALSPQTMTLREAGERYLGHIESRRGLKRATLQDYWLYLRRHLAGPQSPVKQGTRPVKSAPFFEDTQLASITRPDVNRYIDQKIEEGLTPRTLDSHLTFLSAVFRYANEQSWVERNPLSASSARDLMLRTT